MNISEIQIFKIDLNSERVEVIESSTYGNDLFEYLKELFSIVISGSSGRQFRFDRNTTEVRAQITRLNNNENFADISNVIANRLMSVEIDAQEKMSKLQITIQKGILIQAKISQNGENKFIICKADHNEFLDEVNYQLARGLPVKKKAFKAFVCNLYSDNRIDKILVYDTNKGDTKYWWKELLELTMVHTDEDNTERAFDAIDKAVFTKIKKDYPQDYTYLRNSAVKYFRSNERFEMQDFLDNAIGNYQPYDTNLNVENLQEKIRELPTRPRSPFDNQFNIVREKVRARFLSKVTLTPEIDLHIKGDFADNTIFAEVGTDGEKYVKVKSEEGFKYFKNLEHNNNNGNH